jgi:hypothetical protein
MRQPLTAFFHIGGFQLNRNQQTGLFKMYHRSSRYRFPRPFIAFTRIALVVLTVIALWGSLDFSLAAVVEETADNIGALKYYSPKKPKKEEEKKKEKGWDWVLAPIPISNPTIGTGLGATGMILYKLDERSPASNTALGGLYTDSKTRAAGISQTTYFKEDKYRANGLFALYNVNIEFWGIGNSAGDRDEPIPINQRGSYFEPEFLSRIRENIYLGGQYRFIKMDTSLNVGEDTETGREILEDQLDSISSGLGLIFNYDSRDNKYNPYRGTFFDFTTNFASDAIGSDNNYQTYDAAYNYYYGLAERMVLAYRLRGRFSFGDVPFYDLSLFGTSFDLRGYPGGKYRDRMMLVTQLEYRWQFYWRLGMVAFAGVGQVAPELDEFNGDDLLPSAGVGLRFLASKENRLNVSIDCAVGKGSDAIYIYVGEAF